MIKSIQAWIFVEAGVQTHDFSFNGISLSFFTPTTKLNDKGRILHH
ncbi:UNVERIFIED_CONTAM: hypothetical protein ABID98_000341 [Brevibacillus sp. OAP136]|nr:hypothetical protein [Brevibacillus fluminis]